MRPLLIAALSLAMAGPSAVEAQAGTGAAAEPLGVVAAPVTKRLAIVMIQNGSTGTARTQLADTAFIRNIFFGSANSLAAWMPAVTHGLLSYVPAGHGIFLTEPKDALRNGSPTECHSAAARDTAEDHLAALGVQWDSVGVVFDIGGCEWGGLGQMPGRVTWYPPRPSLSAIVHEFGHNQGYPHEAKRDCASAQMSACTAKDYSGNTPMGSGGAGKGYSSVELLHSGWVEPGWLAQASKPGIFSLKPLYSPTSVSGTRVVEYKASATLTYVIETRAPSGTIDTAISNPGVRVYAVNGRDFKNAWLVNPGAHRSAPHLATGAIITDTASKLTISVRSSSVSGAQVAIEAIAPKPSASSSPSTLVTPSAEPSPTDVIDPIPDTDADLRAADTVPRAQRNSWILVPAATVLALLMVAGGAALVRRAAARRPLSRHRRPDDY